MPASRPPALPRREGRKESDAGARAIGVRRRTPAEMDPEVCSLKLSQLADVNGEGAGRRSKRAAVIDVAVMRFGDVGYEATKWSAIADEVGIGQTALYHYFESKAHCLLTILRLELARSHQRFLLATESAPSPAEAMRSAVESAFNVSEAEMSQIRIVLANGDVLRNLRSSEREEGERLKCLALAQLIEMSWTELVAGCLAEVNWDDQDPQIMARAVLGLINSAWNWYRPGGRLSLEEVTRVYAEAVDHILQLPVATS